MKLLPGAYTVISYLPLLLQFLLKKAKTDTINVFQPSLVSPINTLKCLQSTHAFLQFNDSGIEMPVL